MPMSWVHAYDKMKTSKNLAIKWEYYIRDSKVFRYYSPHHEKWSGLFLQDMLIPDIDQYIVRFKCEANQYLLELICQYGINNTINIPLTMEKLIYYTTLLIYYHDDDLIFYPYQCYYQYSNCMSIHDIKKFII